jgi:hypothetical protein
MNSTKRYLCILLAAPLLATAGCDDWLDGAIPKDENLEQAQFASEAGINAVMNGLYRNMSGAGLYGGDLTMTTIELMAHYYYYLDDLSANSNMTTFNYLSKYSYGEAQVKNKFSALWSAMYGAIFRVNNFIANLQKSSVLPEAQKAILLGEAYGLRAFIHLDIFRLFGDVGGAQLVPYNRSAQVISHEQLPVADFYAQLKSDIDSAKMLLQNDPIRTEGVKDLTEVDELKDDVPVAEIFQTYLRNYRFNYYAVRALEARAGLYFATLSTDNLVSVYTAATDVLSCEKFSWVAKNSVAASHDYIFYREVIFGVHNADLYTRWEGYTGGDQLGSTYTVGEQNLQNNIFKNDNPGVDIRYWEDVRASQWQLCRIDGQYTSVKFSRFTSSKANNPIQYFQPLIRMGEMRLIVAEIKLQNGDIGGALTEINTLRHQRGTELSSLPAAITAAQGYDLLETEYYKEFYGEGQAFFFLKRRGQNKIFNSSDLSGNTTDMPAASYIPPIPQGEFDW